MAVLLAVLTAGTAAAVLWMVGEAMRAERMASRQRWQDAADIQLESARQRVEPFFSRRRLALLQLADLPPAQLFAAAVRDKIADSLICGEKSGFPGYPLAGGAGNDAADPPRDSAAAAELLALQRLHSAGRPLPLDAAVRLRQKLNDYSARTLPAPQRRFLMLSVAQLERAPPTEVSDTFDAESLAAQFELEPQSAVSCRLSADGPLLLFRPESLLSGLSALAGTPGISILTDKQSAQPGSSLREIHSALPGWRFALAGDARDQASRRIVLYAWIGGSFVGLLGILTLLTWRHVNSQLRRARLQHDLAATVSHELRTPVASMRILVESMLENPTLEEPECREYLRLIAGENHRLNHLIDNFLTLARLDKTGAAHSSPISIHEFLQRTADNVRAAGQGDRMQLQEPARPLAVHADPALLEVAILNLIDNACKFSPPHSPVILRAEEETPGQLTISVTDQGPGLSPVEQERIWKPFDRLPRHRTTHRGCGLGLAIVHRAACQFHARLEIHSAFGKGSTFRLIIPAIPPASPTHSEAHSHQIQESTTLK